MLRSNIQCGQIHVVGIILPKPLGCAGSNKWERNRRDTPGVDVRQRLELFKKITKNSRP